MLKLSHLTGFRSHKMGKLLEFPKRVYREIKLVMKKVYTYPLDIYVYI